MKKIFTFIITTLTIMSCGKKPTTKTIQNQKEIIFKSPKKFISNNKIQINRTHNKSEIFYFTDGLDIKTDNYNQAILDVVKNFDSTLASYYSSGKDLTSDKIKTAFTKSSTLLFAGSKHKDLLERYFKQTTEVNGQAAILLDDWVKANNVLSIIFKVEEAAFYAGYLSAKYLSDKSYEFDVISSPGLKITAIGGEVDRNSTSYIGGFKSGVEYWNSKASGQNKKVEFVKLGQSAFDHYTGSYIVGSGKKMAENLHKNKIDIVMAANRGQIIDILDYVQKIKSNMLFVGTESDLATKYEEHYNKFITSVTKNVKGVITEAVSTIFGDVDYVGFELGSQFIADVKSGFVSFGENSSNKVSIKDFRKLKNNEEFSKYAASNTDSRFKI